MMSEWGPWIEHDGTGCPVEGQVVESVDAVGCRLVHVAGIHFSGVPDAGDMIPFAWRWSDMTGSLWPRRIVAYRVRRPRGMEAIDEMLRSLDAPEKVDA